MKQTVIRVICILLLAIAFYYLGHTIFSNLEDLKNAELHLEPLSVVLALIAGMLVVINHALIWQFITVTMGCAVPIRQGVQYWLLAESGKYIPGKIFLVVGKFYFYGKSGIPKTRLATCVFFEGVGTLVAQVLFSMMAAYIAGLGGTNISTGLLLAAVVILLISMHPKVVAICFAWGSKISGRTIQQIQFRYRDMFVVVAMYFANTVLLGVSFYFIVNSFVAIEPSHFFLLSGALALSSALGSVAIFAPSGLGVREMSLTILLTTVFSGAVAGIMAIMARLLNTITEAILIAVAAVYMQVQKNRGTW